MKRFTRNGFHIFSETDARIIIENQNIALKNAIRNQDEDYILNVNNAEYVEHLVDKFSILPIEIHRDELSVSTHEEMIPAEYHPNSFFLDQGGAYPRDVIVFHLPFSGDSRLLKMRASTSGMSAPLITIEGSNICFRMINFGQEAQSIRSESDREIDTIEKLNGYLTKDLEQFNKSIRRKAVQEFEARKSNFLSKNDLVASLDIPIKKSDSTPSTFSVPARRTKVITSRPKPKVSEKGYKPEPTLDDKTYYEIQNLVSDAGKQFERLPAIYLGKTEEQLRDHILFLLEPNFEGSATGETFNRKGKTDILLRHDSSNVFVAELKFWAGKKGFLDAITQLLGYLTWRDSKALVVMFVQNKNFSAVLETAKHCISDHENYLDFKSEQEDSWYHYRFHINDDKNREVKLSVMLFHLPK